MGVVDNMKDVADLIKKFGDIELNRRILKLEEEVMDLSRDKRRAEQKAEELEHTLKLRKELVFREPFYWMAGDETPYCPSCWESKNSAGHLFYSHSNGYGEYWVCPTCKHQYDLKQPLRPHRR
jgi:hypothetical protein